MSGTTPVAAAGPNPPGPAPGPATESGSGGGAGPGTPDNAASAATPEAASPKGEDGSRPTAAAGTDNPEDAKVSSGGEAGDATSRRGESTSVHEHLRQAQERIEGDLVANKFVFLMGAEQPVPLRKLTRSEQEAVRHAFVNPMGWDELRLRFSQRRAIILRGPPGRGRRATAIRLLQAAQTRTVFDLDPKVDLARLGSAVVEHSAAADARATAYLVSQPVDATRLDVWVLQTLEEILERSDGRLVLTVGPDATLDSDDLMRYVVDLSTSPSIQDILESHLRWRRGDDDAERLLAHLELTKFVEEHLAADLSFEFASQLAELIAHEPIDAIDVHRLKGRLARRREAFDIWFDGLADLDVRCDAIALAVLNGLPREDVAAAARLLYRRLDTSAQVKFDQAPILRSKGADPFAVSGPQRFRQLQASTVIEAVRGGYGVLPATAVSYLDPSYAKRTIVRAWQDFGIQDILLDWLISLSQDDSDQVQMFAGTALGVISTLSFDYVARRTLVAGARSPSRPRRRGIAVALRVAADDPRLLPAVKSLVAGWYGSGDRHLQATAATAYGLGPRLCGDGDLISNVDALDRLATVDYIVVAVAIGDALASLIFADNLAVAPKVYRTLLAWFDDRDRAACAHLAFLMCAVLLLTEVGEREHETPPKPWPTLLWLANCHPHLRDPLFWLWHRVLDEGLMHDEAESVLTAWAGMAESDDDLRLSFVRMIRMVGSYKDRTRESLLRLAADWVSDERLQPLPKASAAVSAVL